MTTAPLPNTLPMPETQTQSDHGISRRQSRFLRHRPAVIGAVTMLLLIAASIFAPAIVAYQPNKTNISRRDEAPSVQHLLGTDGLGRDVWARAIYGSRISLLVAGVSVTIYLAIGTIVGAVSGYYGGMVDFLLQRLADILLAFPAILLILTFVSLTEPGIVNLFLAIGLLNWPSVARLVRAEVLSLREREYITAARALGASDSSIIIRHILPGLTPMLLVTATFGVAEAILIESSLSFLGLGVPPPAATWGGMIRDAVSITILEQRPWLWLSPGVAIAITVLAVNFVGDGLLAAFNLQQRRPL